MDYLDRAREQVVEALVKLDEAVEGAMLAQSPRSNIERVEKGIRNFRQGIHETLAIIDLAEASLQKAKGG